MHTLHTLSIHTAGELEGMASPQALHSFPITLGRRSEKPKRPHADPHQGVADLAGGAGVQGCLVTDAPSALTPPLVVADALGEQRGRWVSQSIHTQAMTPGFAAGTLLWVPGTYPPAVNAGVIARGTLTARALPAALTHTCALGAATTICKVRGDITAWHPDMGCIPEPGCKWSAPISMHMCKCRVPQTHHVLHPHVPVPPTGLTGTCRH